MIYHVIYDGNCNLCVNLVKLLEQVDPSQQFSPVANPGCEDGTYGAKS